MKKYVVVVRGARRWTITVYLTRKALKNKLQEFSRCPSFSFALFHRHRCDYVSEDKTDCSSISYVETSDRPWVANESNVRMSLTISYQQR